MELYLIRHTAPDVPTGTCYGRTDVPLASSYRTDISGVISKLRIIPDRIYSSPSLRCSLLAESIIESFENKLEYSDLLMELNFGSWEGKLWSEIPESESVFWTENFVQAQTPNGESYGQLFDRVSTFLENKRNFPSDEKIGIVTHAGVIRSILCKYLNLPLETGFRFEVGYGSIGKLKIERNGTEVSAKLIFWNL
ncbi:alpha-ribazole phosphatase [Leptospira gomenensis]|uniref:Alpha-ribazole phosphatase n=1 Tax=Leptospira gomenensis TaxID=2484974 RepID=A0A5F1Z2I9_9LEPT|nr:alpha-ribazole phosphatase [Leptospira gomenensis]TGK28773.1 alpha-ribazole phosphatase [Leptospira gomenensis]TGK37640.1 alpha-ribazole phosphatase [Leptospira gomenensis]TGK51531.1 alpha-ribazole phosphatase [Leptospira gomenensis]TGK68088.1 alpha-ribazole phosphatase [Leptospira gomenensis]